MSVGYQPSLGASNLTLIPSSSYKTCKCVNKNFPTPTNLQNPRQQMHMKRACQQKLYLNKHIASVLHNYQTKYRLIFMGLYEFIFNSWGKVVNLVNTMCL